MIDTTLLLSMAKRLSDLISKPGVEAISAKLMSLRDEKDNKELRIKYEEIVLNLIEEKNEALNLAKSYQDEINKIQISEEDITSLHKTISDILNIISEYSPNDSIQINGFKTMQDLISIETLRTLQLIGFNYKEAIGETFTNIVKAWIELKLLPKSTNKTQPRRNRG